MKSAMQSVRKFVREHRWQSITGAAVVLALVAFLLLRGGAGTETPEPENNARQVSVSSVRALSQSGGGITFLGEVRSQSEAELRVVRGGEVTAVNVAAGDTVSAGTILASVKNGPEQAGVTQARGALSAAEAQLTKARAGSRPEDIDVLASQQEGASQSLGEARVGAVNAFRQAYTLAENAVFGQADNFFRNPRTVRPNFVPISATYEESRALEDTRVEIGNMLETWKSETESIDTNDNLESAANTAEGRLNTVKSFLDQVSIMISRQEMRDDLPQATIDAQEAAILTARTSVDSALAAISGARSGIASAQQGAEVASAQLNRAQAGERPEDIRVAEATVTQARGSLQAALASLEQTLIRTPISGTVSTLNLDQGGFAVMGDVAAIITNDNALEIEASVAGDMQERIQVGDEAIIEERYAGTVTSVEPGLDPITKKARVTIGVTDPNALLTHGAFVDVAITPRNAEEIAAQEPQANVIPITAIKILADGFAVFTVDENTTLVAQPIEEGPIVGDRMIVEGLDPNLVIVEDVRGLAAGDAVVTSEN